MIKKIHKIICNYHDKVRQKSFIKWYCSFSLSHIIVIKMIRKKQTVSPPSKYVGAVSPRNAPQEAIISDTSIRAYEYME